MSLRYLSVCSGIEAATVAWHGFGWTPVAFGEIEAFPSAVLRTHYPDVPNWGDMTKFQEWPDAAIDVLVGGTPCQSFSVAGLRKGLADPRGNLALTYLAIAHKYRPRWLVWENVPGVLSSNGGRDFGAFVGGLGELGYGWAYRILDAQYFGVAQRRRRVFVVGCLGGWQRAAAVLVEQHSLSGHPSPRRETRESVTGSLAARTRGGGGLGTDFDCAGGLIASTGDVAACLETTSHDYSRADGFTMIAQALRGEGFDASENGTGRGTPLLPVAFHPTQDPIISTDGTTHAMGCGSRQGQASVAVAAFVDVGATLKGGSGARGYPDPSDGNRHNLVAHDIKQVQWTSGGGQVENDTAQALRSNAEYNYQFARVAMQVRDLTPMECERLQGFPDGYTAIPWRGKDAADCPDGPRYKALGNSMAVPVMRWLGERLAAVEGLH